MSNGIYLQKIDTLIRYANPIVVQRVSPVRLVWKQTSVRFRNCPWRARKTKAKWGWIRNLIRE